MRLIRDLSLSLLLVSVSTVAMVLVASPAISQVRPSGEPLAIIDAREDAAQQERARVSSQQAQAEQQLRNRYPNLRISWNPSTGTPRTLYNLGGFLTESAPDSEPAELVMDFMRSNSALFGLSAADLESLSISRQTVPEGRVPQNGRTDTVRNLAFDQRWQGRQVYPASLVASVTADGRLVSLAGEIVPNLSGAVNATEPALTPLQAIERAAVSIDVEIDPSQHQPMTDPDGPERRQIFARGSEFNADVPVRLIYYAVSRESVRIVWEAIVGKAEDPYAYQVLVDAQTGGILLRVTITDNDTPQWRAFADVLNTPVVDPRIDVRPFRSPAPLSPGPATPTGAQGGAVGATLVQTDGDPGLSPGGWLETAAVNSTTGNNVIAFVDLDFDSTADPGEQPTASIVNVGGTPTRTFDFTADFTAAPTTAVNRDAATTNVFFLANWFHDRLYALGFDEGAGNFQQNNFTGFGVAGDPILARLQVGFDNSTFGTPVADGTCCPTLNAFTFTGPTPDHDAAFDAEVMVHEFTHGLTNRIIGGPNVRGLYGFGQPRGLGEGYSDIYALLLLSEPTDDPDGAYALGGWVTRELVYVTPQPPPWLDNYHFGIRHFPYSTDLCTYPFTLLDMQTATYDITPIASASCGATPAVSPWLAISSGGPHDMGEIWAAALWEVRRNLIAKHGWAVGNELAIQLITDSLFSLAQNPTFMEARDAVVQADVSRTGGDNLSCIWEGFAKRGFGAAAQTPTSGVFTEDFTSAVTGTCVGPQLEHAFSVHIGTVDPVGPFSSILDNGRTLNLDYVRTVNPNLAWDVRLGLSQFDSLLPGVPDLDVLTLASNVRYTINPGAPVTVFVNGGLGLYDLDPGDLENGYNVGVGLTRVLGSTLTFEATYNRHSTFTASPDLEYDQLQVGLLFSF